MTHTNIITEAAAIIRKYNPRLAAEFIASPFRRVDLAHAFARGFVKNESDDVHPLGSLVIRVALADRQARQASAA